MNKAIIIKSFLLIITAVILSGCSGKFSKNKIREGIIEYDIIYLENKMGNISTSMLPKTMTMRFKDHLSMYRINGLFGAFVISNISDARHGTNTTLLKLLDNKYCYEGSKNEYACCFDNMDGLNIVETNEVKNILGFNCKKAIATFPGTERNPFIIYYTDDIRIKKPNNTNPYHDINGVLMEFELNLNQVNMRLKPRSFHKTEVSTEEFEIPDGYRRVSRKKMEEIFNELME